MPASIPEPWVTAMRERGFLSMRSLAAAARVSPETIRALIDGRRAASPRTIHAVGDALRLPEETIATWAGTSRVVEGDPYTPPREAELLDPYERSVVDMVIRAIVREKRAAPVSLAQRRQRERPNQDPRASSPLLRAAYAPGTSEYERQTGPQDAAGEEPQDADPSMGPASPPSEPS